MTIQDLFKKDNDKLGVMSSFNPEVSRGLNALFGTKVYNPKTGRVEDLGEAYPRRVEAQMEAEKQRAMEQEKMQQNYSLLDKDMVDWVMKITNGGYLEC